MTAIQDICTAIWANATRTLLDGDPLASPTTPIELICDACWKYATRTLTGEEDTSGHVRDRLLYPITAGANVFCIATQRGTAGILVNTPADATWTTGSPVSFDVDFDAAGYAFINWDNTLEAWWRFENEGVSPQDWSGNGHHLGYAGAYTTGLFGGFAQNVANAADSSSPYGRAGWLMERDSKWTIAMWVACTTDAGHNDLIDISGPGAGIKIYQHVGGEYLVVNYYDRRTATVVSAAEPHVSVDGTWHHFVAVIDMQAGTWAHYVDGVYKDEKSLYSGNSLLPMEVLAIRLGGTNYLNGAIDEVLLFSRKLTANEITALYAVGASSTLTADIVVEEDTTHTFEIVHVSSTSAVTKTGEHTLLVNAP